MDTVTIVTPAGPTRINASDYNPNVHKLAEGQEAPAVVASATAAPVIEGAPAVVVIKTPAGPTRINASDFDPAKHTLDDGQEAPPAPVPVIPPSAANTAPPAPAPVVGDASTPGTEPPVPVTPPPPPATTTVTTPPPPPAPVTTQVAFVMPEGNKFFVVDKDGKKLSKQGFKVEAGAQEAAKKLNTPTP